MLKQVQETGLFKHVVAFLSSVNSCCRNMPSLGHKDDLPDVAASVCCQGAEILAGKFGSSERFCCRETCVKCLNTDGDKPITVVSTTVVDGSCQQGVDVLVPSFQMGDCGCGPSNCIGMYPAGNDILTVLLLALPTETWSGMKDEKLSKEIHNLVSTENLPTLLQEEVTTLSWDCFYSFVSVFKKLVCIFYQWCCSKEEGRKYFSKIRKLCFHIQKHIIFFKIKTLLELERL